MPYGATVVASRLHCCDDVSKTRLAATSHKPRRGAKNCDARRDCLVRQGPDIYRPRHVTILPVDVTLISTDPDMLQSSQLMSP